MIGYAMWKVDFEAGDALVKGHRCGGAAHGGFLGRIGPAVRLHVSQPALVLHYRGDRVIPFVGGKQLAAGLPNSRLVTLDGPFHLPDAADLPRIVDLVVNFLSDTTAGPSDR